MKRGATPLGDNAVFFLSVCEVSLIPFRQLLRHRGGKGYYSGPPPLLTHPNGKYLGGGRPREHRPSYANSSKPAKSSYDYQPSFAFPHAGVSYDANGGGEAATSYPPPPAAADNNYYEEEAFENYDSSNNYGEEEGEEEEYYDGAVRPLPFYPRYDYGLESANQVKEDNASSDATARTKATRRWHHRHRGSSNGTRTTTTPDPLSPYRLKVYPERQRVHPGGDAVLRCRDEGRARARVRWRRKDGRRMPGGSRSRQDEKGRLTLW